MTDWTAGYVADIDYTFGYYPELNPLRSRLAFLCKGINFQEPNAVCELGFGQGLSVNAHATSQNGRQYWATDFNPTQAGFAQSLAAVSGSGAKLFDQSFAKFCSREDLPDFDFIGLHGIWSWISDDNRAVIVDFVRRKLKVGGTLYISYNTLDGWATMLPMRHLLTEHAQVMGSPGQGIVSRIDAALEFAEKLLATTPGYARANPHVAERVKKIKEQNRNYLAHEYFNRDWKPMSFAEMAQWLAPTKLTYVCSANFLDHVDALNLTPEQKEFLTQIPDDMFRETVRSFCMNSQFRKDYWVRGPRKLSSLDQTEAIRAQELILVSPREDVSLKAKGGLGEATMQEEVYVPILDVLADHQPKSIGQIEKILGEKRIGLSQLIQAVMVLVGKGALMAVQGKPAADKARARVVKLNSYLCYHARGSADINYLASPVTGGGVLVYRFFQLFLLAKKFGKTKPVDLAEFVWGIIAPQGQRLVIDGKTLQDKEENLAELTDQATKFTEKWLPIYKALGIT